MIFESCRSSVEEDASIFVWMFSTGWRIRRTTVRGMISTIPWSGSTLGVTGLTRLVASSLKCKNGGTCFKTKLSLSKFLGKNSLIKKRFRYGFVAVNRMLKRTTLLSMLMVELVSGAGLWILWTTCYVQLYVTFLYSFCLIHGVVDPFFGLCRLLLVVQPTTTSSTLAGLAETGERRWKYARKWQTTESDQI